MKERLKRLSKLFLLAIAQAVCVYFMAQSLPWFLVGCGMLALCIWGLFAAVGETAETERKHIFAFETIFMGANWIFSIIMGKGSLLLLLVLAFVACVNYYYYASEKRKPKPKRKNNVVQDRSNRLKITNTTEQYVDSDPNSEDHKTKYGG
jgi:uncharacterized membrane protein